MYQLNTKPHSLFEKRGFNNLSMASPLLKGFKLVVNRLTVPCSILLILALMSREVNEILL